ncbi:hypothetical protein ACFFGR_14220, partial [Arthrobacter liuii]|uniref:hypothetical protein n=1 Tax=Arthrobacter liuii TaxID=1476996 RepID=UPI0035EC5E0C
MPAITVATHPFPPGRALARFLGWVRYRPSDLTWLISLVREFWVADGIENGLLLGGNIGGERLRG